MRFDARSQIHTSTHAHTHICSTHKLYTLFCSDNGAWTEEGLNGGSNGLLRGQKGETWEGGMRYGYVELCICCTLKEKSCYLVFVGRLVGGGGGGGGRREKLKRGGEGGMLVLSVDYFVWFQSPNHLLLDQPHCCWQGKNHL